MHRLVSPFVRLMGLIWITLAMHSASAETTIEIVVLGDSLAAGYGLAHEEGLVPRLQTKLDAVTSGVTLVNAGVSGDTTTGGLARLDWSVGASAKAVILELGGNDALRGISPDQSRANLDQMLQRLQERALPVLVVGMRAPANLGEAYSASFNPIYADLAAKYDALLYPYFFEGLLEDPAYAQSDGIHPSAKGVEVVTDKMLPIVLELIEQVRHN